MATRGIIGTRGHRPGLWGAAFAVPAILYIAAFQLYPILFSVYISLNQYDLLSPPRWVGLRYYAELAGDRAFLNALRVTIVYVVYTVVPVIGFSYGLGYALTRIGRSRGLWRTLIFLPSVMPLVSVALTWKLLFNFQGPLNGALGDLGLAPVAWLNSSAYAPWAMILMSWWHATSYYTIIFLAGFLAIPRDYYEAASLDGAGGFALMRHVTLPLMKPTIALVVVLATVNGLKTFAFQQILTDGGPAGATQILTLLIYRTSFSFLEMGRAGAYSVVLFGGILVISLLQIWLLRDRHA
ncbi:carbohydrate ABC transporter permease [Labrys wisconsinensis]|uniref:ABC-type sugar transport system permease subunit n=1 Tax=Labrys wisconsinensis TaxID=425677 RepID=A0ABU0JMU0_9HYPH|nr:sugar ABC transporter permease [Labrys wisconsinensis]MDQ0474614.1 ABC-type sugar transport system permease subunit [Labrys wisconsinensis]